MRDGELKAAEANTFPAPSSTEELRRDKGSDDPQ